MQMYKKEDLEIYMKIYISTVIDIYLHIYTHKFHPPNMYARTPTTIPSKSWTLHLRVTIHLCSAETRNEQFRQLGESTYLD